MFKQKFTNQTGVKCRSTCSEDEPFGARQIAQIGIYTAKFYPVVFAVDSTTHTGAKSFGLLKNFLEHMVGEGAQLDLFQRKFNLTELFADCDIFDCFRMEAIRGDGNHLVVGKVYRLSSMLYDSGGIGGHNEFVIADP